MSDDDKDPVTADPPAQPMTPEEKKAAERRRDGRRSTERKSETVRAAIRDELAEDAPEAEERQAVKEKEGESEAVIELDHIFLAFDNPILEDVSFVARKGETICLVGESGTGKSTALKLILRLLVPDKGCCPISEPCSTVSNFNSTSSVEP